MTIDTTDEDRRVRQTKGAVMGAFLELVLRKRYDQLKVSEIIARAGVARSTFYEHYWGKDELLRQGLAGPLGVIAGAADADCDAALLEATVRHFWQHRRIANSLLSGGTRAIVTRLLAELIEPLLPTPPTRAEGVPPGLIARQIAGGQIALLAAWLAGEAACAPKAIADALRRGGCAMTRA